MVQAYFGAEYDFLCGNVIRIMRLKTSINLYRIVFSIYAEHSVWVAMLPNKQNAPGSDPGFGCNTIQKIYWNGEPKPFAEHSLYYNYY